MPFNRHSRHRIVRGRALPMVLLAVACFGLVAMLPSILPAPRPQSDPTAPTIRYGVLLLVAPSAPTPVSVPRVAEPIQPGLPPAQLSTANAVREAALVSAEDWRLRTLLHDSYHVLQPQDILVKGSLPTLVLPANNKVPYTVTTLVQHGALVLRPHNAALLVDNVFVAANASLNLGSGLRTLYLASGKTGFSSIVAWHGSLTFSGTARQPLTIMGWDRTANAPAADRGYGRAYIREAGGKMTLTYVRARSLGFWSGRTGGIAWTGLSGRQSTGGATSSDFIGDTYGAFVSRGYHVSFNADLFELNELDGLRVHRYSANTTVTASSAVRNGGSGFAASPSTQRTLFEADIAEHNRGDGFFLDGQPLATSASASGGSVAMGSGASVRFSAALDNGKSGILVEGGTGTVIEGDQVCAAVTAVSVRSNAVNAVVTGNTVGCRPRSGFAVGPGAPGIVLSGNAVDGARTAFLIRTAGHVEIDQNRITNGTVFGVSARGANSTVTGIGNTIAGNGFRAIDAREAASVPALFVTNSAGWAFHSHVTFLTYLQFHPLAAMWIGIVALSLLAWLWSRLRRRPSHPYPNSTRWSGEAVSLMPMATEAVSAVRRLAVNARPAGEAGMASASSTWPGSSREAHLSRPAPDPWPTAPVPKQRKHDKADEPFGLYSSRTRKADLP